MYENEPYPALPESVSVPPHMLPSPSPSPSVRTPPRLSHVTNTSCNGSTLSVTQKRVIDMLEQYKAHSKARNPSVTMASRSPRFVQTSSVGCNANSTYQAPGMGDVQSHRHSLGTIWARSGTSPRMAFTPTDHATKDAPLGYVGVPSTFDGGPKWKKGTPSLRSEVPRDRQLLEMQYNARVAKDGGDDKGSTLVCHKNTQQNRCTSDCRSSAFRSSSHRLTDPSKKHPTAHLDYTDTRGMGSMKTHTPATCWVRSKTPRVEIRHRGEGAKVLYNIKGEFDAMKESTHKKTAYTLRSEVPRFVDGHSTASRVPGPGTYTSPLISYGLETR